LNKSDSEMVFKIPNTQVKLSKTFRILRKMCVDQEIKDFSLNQSSLENVFLSFAR